MKAFFGRGRLAAFAGATLFIAVSPAAAQLYFRPFFQPFAYTFGYEQPVEGEAPARYGSRRAVASILAREGFRLVGPLGRRGEQIVATGYSRSEGEMRFIVDPYEGRIIRGARVRSEDDRGPRRNDSAEYVEPLNGSRAVVRELDREDTPRANRRQPSARRNEASERDANDIRNSARAPAPRRITPAPRAASPKPEEARAPEARPEPLPSATPEQVKSTPRAVNPGHIDAPPTVVAAPARPAPTAPTATQPMRKAADYAGGAPHRAIVPPTASSSGPTPTATTN